LLSYEAEDSTIGAAVRLYGEWAEEEIFFLSRWIGRGAGVIEVGAHIGTHSLAFARFVGPAGIVVAMDAQERAYQLLVLNIALNQARQVKCIRALVGRESGCRFVAPEGEKKGNLGAVAFFEDVIVSPDAPFLLPLPMMKLDDLSLQRCDLIKIDIEGMEFDALVGADETIRRFRPVIYFEQARPEHYAETVSLLQRAGYRLFWHVADPFNRHNYRAHRRNIFGGAKELNILAWPENRGKMQPPEGSSLHPINGSAYEPPGRLGPDSGWPMAADAYEDSPPLQSVDLKNVAFSAG